MARTPRREFSQGTNGSPRQRSAAPPRQEPDPGWRSGEESGADEEFEEDEDEDLEEAEHEILLDEDLGNLGDTQNDDEDDL